MGPHSPTPPCLLGEPPEVRPVVRSMQFDPEVPFLIGNRNGEGTVASVLEQPSESDFLGLFALVTKVEAAVGCNCPQGGYRNGNHPVGCPPRGDKSAQC